jgi:hypothetical protein
MTKSTQGCVFLGPLGSLTIGPILYVIALFKEPRQVCLPFLGSLGSLTLGPIHQSRLLLYCSRSQGKYVLAYLGSLGSLTIGPIPSVTVLFKERRQVCLSVPWLLGSPNSQQDQPYLLTHCPRNQAKYCSAYLGSLTRGPILSVMVLFKEPRQVYLILPWFLGFPTIGTILTIVVLFKEPRQVCLSLPWLFGYLIIESALFVATHSKEPWPVYLSLPWLLGLLFVATQFKGPRQAYFWQLPLAFSQNTMLSTLPV